MNQPPDHSDLSWGIASPDGAQPSNTVQNLHAPIINVVHQPVIQTAENAGESASSYEIPSADAWDFAQQGNSILNVYNVPSQKKASSPILKVVLPLLIVLIAGIVYFEFEVEQNSHVTAVVNRGKKYFTVAQPETPKPVQFDPVKSSTADTKINTQPSINPKQEKFEKKLEKVLVDMVRPYALLPNLILPDAKPPKSPWSLKEEEDLKILIKHKFYYQRYHAVEKVRHERFVGSQEILRSALTQKHLWIKANSLIGLADAGMNPTDVEIRKVFDHVRKATLANYLKRYEGKHLTTGESYFMRLALQYGHPAARLQALKNILASPDELTELYVNAAQRDDAEKIVRWFNNTDEIRHNKTYLSLVDEAIELNQVLKFQRSWRHASKVSSEPSSTLEIQSPKTPAVVTFYEIKNVN